MAAYTGNRAEAVESVIESDAVASAVRALVIERTKWAGTATELLGTLSARVDERVAKAKSWPETARALSGRLRRAATSLRQSGSTSLFARRAAPGSG